MPTKEKRLCKTFTLPDGSRKWVYAKTQEELERKTLEMQILIGRGVDVTNRETFGEFALVWFKTYKEPNLRYNSIKVVRNVLNNHLLPEFSGYQLRQIMPVHVVRFFNRLATEKSLSLNRNIYGVFNSIMSEAEKNNLIAKNPCTGVKVSGHKKVDREPLTDAEAEALLSTLRNNSDEMAHRCWLFCLLGLKTGLRRGELCGLMWNDIDLDNGMIHVQHNVIWHNDGTIEVTTDTKTEAGKRDVPIPLTALSALKWERNCTDSLYVLHDRNGKVMGNSDLTYMWRRAAAILPDRQFSPHVLRHTYCTKLFEAGLDVKEVQYLMGHATPEMTMQIYTHYRKSDRIQSTAEKIRAVL